MAKRSHFYYSVLEQSFTFWYVTMINNLNLQNQAIKIGKWLEYRLHVNYHEHA